MRKQKTKKAAAKRFKISAGGKLMHRSHHLRHLRASKSKRQIRDLKKMKVVEGTYEKKIKRMLGVL